MKDWKTSGRLQLDDVGAMADGGASPTLWKDFEKPSTTLKVPKLKLQALMFLKTRLRSLTAMKGFTS